MNIFLSILFFLTWGDTCYKDLYYGDVVRDHFGWKGSVLGFIPEKDLVSVGLFHTPSRYDFPYDDLGKRVLCYLEFCTGETVLDPYKNEVDIVEIYNNKLVYVFDSSIDGILSYSLDEIEKMNFLQ